MRVFAGCWLLFAVGGCAQDTIKVDVDVVNVFCTVRDRRGALIKDLDKDDFQIREDGKPQRIRFFARETDLPLTLGLLVDVSGSVRRTVQAEKDTAERFLRQVLRAQDQALLVGFSSTIVMWQDFTDSPSLLRETLDKLHAIPFRGVPKDGGPAPATLLYDAVYSTAANKFQNVSGRKAMLVISDGIDIGSRQTIQNAIGAAQTANTIVYGICYRNARESGCSYLHDIADPTGGRMFAVTPETPLASIFETIQEELRSQYSIGYVSTNAARDGSYRKLRVEVRPKGLKVETRKGYYAR
jgi:VWFA-related protein